MLYVLPQQCPRLWQVNLSFSCVEGIQLIEALHFASGTLSITQTWACNRAICFPQKAVQTLSLGSQTAQRPAMNWPNPRGAGYWLGLEATRRKYATKWDIWVCIWVCVLQLQEGFMKGWSQFNHKHSVSIYTFKQGNISVTCFFVCFMGNVKTGG